MKIAIAGGGITGLTAAYLLSEKKHQVYVFEKEKKLGGLASSIKKENWDWTVENYYHHFFSSDNEILSLLRDLNIENKLFFKKPITSVFADGKMWRFDTPISLLAFPKLNLTDKLQMAISTLLLKINPFWKPLEKITSYDFVKKVMGTGSFNLIWKPLLDSKFGPFAEKIPASWFWTRIKKRSFNLGYLQEGISSLIKSLEEKVKENQGKILLDSPVEKVKKRNGFFEITINNKVFSDKFDKIIFTVPPTVLIKIFPQLSAKEKNNIAPLKSLGSLCLTFELKSNFFQDQTYWLNVNDSSFPFVAVVEHTNFIDKKNYGGSVILYAGGYYSQNDPLFKMTQKEVLKKFQPFLNKINPQYNFDKEIIGSWLAKDYYAQPVPNLNYSKNLPDIKLKENGAYWGCLHHVYPQDRGINYAIELGRKIADEISS